MKARAPEGQLLGSLMNEDLPANSEAEVQGLQSHSTSWEMPWNWCSGLLLVVPAYTPLQWEIPGMVLCVRFYPEHTLLPKQV